MTNVEAPRVSIGPSNLNLRPVDALRFAADDYREFADAGGYDESAGYEITPLRFPAAQRAAEQLAEDGDSIVLHESWRESGLRDVLRQRSLGGLVTEAGIIAAFPLLDKSYIRLARIQAKSQQRLPIIVHPQGQHLGSTAPRRPRQSVSPYYFGETLFQPTAEWASAAGINIHTTRTDSLASQIDEAAQEQGLDGMALDLHHIQARRDGLRFPDPVSLAGALAAKASLHEVQLSLRPEFEGDEAAVRMVCQGEIGKTMFGEMLKAINQSAAPGTIRLVVEAQAGIVEKLSGNNSLHQAHHTITCGIRRLMHQTVEA